MLVDSYGLITPYWEYGKDFDAARFVNYNKYMFHDQCQSVSFIWL